MVFVTEQRPAVPNSVTRQSTTNGTARGENTDGWPEDEVPPHIDPDSLSVLADHGNRVIWGEGLPAAPIFIVLDNPGAREDADGRPFVCGTRRTLWEAVEAAGIAPERCYVTYLLKRRPRRAYAREHAWRAYEPVLNDQFRASRPRVLVFCGGTVINALLDANLEIKDARGNKFTYSGFPVVAAYHPLAARRRPQLFPSLVADLALARTVAGA